MSGQKSVVVTGTRKGIGRSVAEALTTVGWAVVGVERAEESTSIADGACRDVVIGDSSHPDTHRRAAHVAQRIAPLAGWVNNAGVTMQTPLHQLDEERVRAIVDINGLGYIWGCSAAVQAFTAQATTGSIVNIGSIHGRASHVGYAAYEFTKGGIDALSRSVAVSYGRYGIRANTLAPGGVMTPHLRAQIDSSSDPDAAERDLSEGPPMRRIAESSEIAEITAFLLDERSAYINGESIAADGGWTASFGSAAPDPDLDARYGI